MYFLYLSYIIIQLFHMFIIKHCMQTWAVQYINLVFSGVCTKSFPRMCGITMLCTGNGIRSAAPSTANGPLFFFPSSVFLFCILLFDNFHTIFVVNHGLSSL